MKPRALIFRTAGINCDKESVHAFEMAGADVDLFHINYLKEKEIISNYQILCIPGGFSYGDDLGAGKILSLEFSLWFKDQLHKFIDKGGLVIGICNGFQVMVKMGILPDVDFSQKVTLTENDSARFETRWVYLKVENTSSAWLKGLANIIALPIAHGEGKFYTDKENLVRIESNNRVAFRYVDRCGSPVGYPLNPNGSLGGIAGITDASGRILGLMPHPERFVFKHQHPFWMSEDHVPFGLQMFKNAVKYFE
ncbi:MAG: phosphoribosylformylglycinamidine synthase I [Candidatus Omnitrophica bacterium]|nr:phosphoribosylformylglycinamidine synthase I [Candidatus Omnitrophota bacterium]